MKIRNINPDFRMDVEFSSVAEMEAAIRKLEQLNGGEWMPVDGLKEGRDYEIVPATLSIDNGLTFIGADELYEYADEILSRWDAIAEAMNDEIREAVHAEMAPCSELEFLAAYLRNADSDLIVG